MREDYPYADLMQFLYREMPATEAAEMALRLEEDPALRAEYDALSEAKSQLPRDRFNPSPSVLTTILQYSTKTAMEAQLYRYRLSFPALAMPLFRDPPRYRGIFCC